MNDLFSPVDFNVIKIDINQQNFNPDHISSHADDNNVTMFHQLPNSKNINVFLLDFVKNHRKFLDIISNTVEIYNQFDSVIIDPPKHLDVIKHVYSSEFLNDLSSFVRKKAIVSCYIPMNMEHGAHVGKSIVGMTKMTSLLNNIKPCFEATGKYKMLGQPDDFIFTFQRI